MAAILSRRNMEELINSKDPRRNGQLTTCHIIKKPTWQKVNLPKTSSRAFSFSVWVDFLASWLLGKLIIWRLTISPNINSGTAQLSQDTFCFIYYERVNSWIIFPSSQQVLLSLRSAHIFHFWKNSYSTKLIWANILDELTREMAGAAVVSSTATHLGLKPV